MNETDSTDGFEWGPEVAAALLSGLMILTEMDLSWHGSMKALIPKEWQLHAFVADLLRLKAKPGVLYFHVPNEGKRSARTGAFLKRLGMLPGVADFVVIINARAHFLELKTRTGRQSPEQLMFARAAEDAGAVYVVVRSPEEAEEVLSTWEAI